MPSSLDKGGGAAGAPPARRETSVVPESSIDDRIGRVLAESDAEMRASPAFGKPLPDDGYLDTPPELRLAFKVLKNAGAVPAEVALMQELQRCRDELATGRAGATRMRELRARVVDLELTIALRLERLARTLAL